MNEEVRGCQRPTDGGMREEREEQENDTEKEAFSRGGSRKQSGEKQLSLKGEKPCLCEGFSD